MDDALRLENQLCFPLYACARKVVGKYTPLLKPLNITYTQYIVFLVLWDCGSITIRELCRKLYLDTGTLTPLLKKMQTEGYVERRRDPEDERVVIVTLTEKGYALKEQVKDVPGSVGSCMPLTAEEAVALYSLLYKVLGSIDEDEET